jgi:isocitrate lyase
MKSVVDLEKMKEIYIARPRRIAHSHRSMGSRPAGQDARRNQARRNQEGVISMSAIGEQAALLQHEWQTDPRWAGITRDYSALDVIRLRGRVAGEHSVARRAASRLWGLLHTQDTVRALGAATGNHAAQLARAGSQAIYLPGQAGRPGDGIALTGRPLVPVVADAETGIGGVPDAFELMTAMIEAGAAGVRFEDHLGGTVLIPTGQHIETLNGARLASDVLGVPSLVIARTGARTASLLTSDIDERDHEFLTGERTAEGFYRVEPGLYACGTRALAFAPYADVLWLETPEPDLAAARAFACVIHSQYPDKLLAYSCSPSFNWRAQLDDAAATSFRKELAALGYRFQVTTPAGFRTPDDVRAYGQPYEAELALEPSGFTAARP